VFRSQSGCSHNKTRLKQITRLFAATNTQPEKRFAEYQMSGEESVLGVRRPYQRLGGIISRAIGSARTAIKAGNTQTSIGIIAESQPDPPLATSAKCTAQANVAWSTSKRKVQALEIIQGGGGTNVVSRVDPGEFTPIHPRPSARRGRPPKQPRRELRGTTGLGVQSVLRFRTLDRDRG
jgi:hypothetical protein